MPAKNGVVGSDAFGVDLPRTELDEETTKEIQQAAKFAKSQDFKDLKAHLENRIAFYQTYLPDGRPVPAVDADKLAPMWIAANVIIGECRAIINGYEQAGQTQNATEQ